MNADQKKIESLLTEDEFGKWLLLGEKILGASSPTVPRLSDPQSEFYAAFCEAGPSLLKEGSYHHLNNWAEQGLEISARSLPVAIEFFRSTPVFLRSESVFRLRSWASGVMQILSRESNGGLAASAFFQSSAILLQFMTFRELREWTRTGLALARKSPPFAEEYFSLVPDGLDQLYSTEWLRICQIGAQLARTHPEKVVPLFRRSPSLLLKMSPALRNVVLDAVKRSAATDPATVDSFFEEMAAALQSLLYPVQEMVLESLVRIEEISRPAVRNYINSVSRLLEDMHDTFLPLWIDRGIEILTEDSDEGIRYFSLQSPESDCERSKWENAVLLDDFQQQLALFTHALAGKRLEIRATDELEAERESSKRQYPTGNGEEIYLLPFIADEQSPGDNFRQYKMAAAHQAGYVAYGTFDDGLAGIISHLSALPSGELALDIFYILEDGRIDRLLGGEYAGLRQDMHKALSSAMDKRPELSTFPPKEAMVEILLRRTTGYLVERDIPDELGKHMRVIDDILASLFESASSVWDTYTLSRRIFDYINRLSDGVSYTPTIPIAYRGRLDPELLPGPGLPKSIPGDITDALGTDKGLIPIPLEELKALIEKTGIPENIELLEKEDLDAEGLYTSDLEGIKAKGVRKEPGPYDGKQERASIIQITAQDTKAEGSFHYDEWDYLAGAYRRKWCRLHERIIEPAESGRVDEICDIHKDLIVRVRKQFQRIRPDILEIVRRVEWGDDIDFPAMVQGIVERKAGISPSDKIFTRREKKVRQVATLFLMDMSASTSETVQVSRENMLVEKKIIDIEIEGLVVLMEALEALSDQYGIFGFSGYGRGQVDFYRIKAFSDNYSEELKQRICGIEPKQGTRMGPAIRHAVGKLRAIGTDQRILLLLSDGYPQDHDYGEDRRTNEYGLHDTMMALLEAKKEGIKPFCITVDQSGNDYLRKMCDPRSYLVIKDIDSLPEVLPRVVESLMA